MSKWANIQISKWANEQVKQFLKEATAEQSNFWMEQLLDEATFGPSKFRMEQLFDEVTFWWNNFWTKQHLDKATFGRSKFFDEATFGRSYFWTQLQLEEIWKESTFGLEQKRGFDCGPTQSSLLSLLINTVLTIIDINNVITAIASVLLCRLV